MIDKIGFTFYPQAWLSDEKLSRCSLQAKGMWIDLLCHMHSGDPYGYLIFNKKALNIKEIQHLLRLTNQASFTAAWQELLDKGIIQQDPQNGAFFSKRMIVEHKKQKSKLTDLKKLPFYAIVKEIIDHLNTISNRKFPIDVYTYDLIDRWYKEGCTIKDFKIVNEIKYKEWKDNDTMSGYIRPSTLYGDKFLNYLNQNPNYKLKNNAGAQKWKFSNYYSTQQEITKNEQ